MAAGLIAVFALHVLWQAPLFASVAWVAARLGRPGPRVAYRLWMLTLVLCVVAPAGWTVAARRAAMEAERGAGVTVRYDAAAFAGALPAMRREPAWKRMVRRHLNTRDGLQPFTLTLSPRLVRPIAGLYLLVVVLFAVRLVVAWRATRGLVRRASAEGVPEHLHEALRLQCGDVSAPELRLSGEIAGPVLAGTLRPTLLLPLGSVETMTAEELEAVLAHELAHVRRRDPLQHAAALLLLVPVAFHPAALWTARRVRQTREMACDADAAERMQSAQRYARALLQVAERAGSSAVAGGRWGASLGMFTPGLGVVGLEMFGQSGAMEERMKTILNGNGGVGAGGRAVRAAVCAGFGAVAVLTACMLQVQPAVAHAQQTALVTKDDAGPALIGGEHAQEQLRNARRELAEAERTATTDEQKQKLRAAQTLAAVTERQLAAASNPQQMIVNLEDNGEPGVRVIVVPRVDLKGMNIKVDPHVFADVNSPEFRKQMADVKAQFDSPEYRQKMEELRKQMQSPEFRAQMERATKIDQEQIKRDLADAMKQQAQIQRDIAEAVKQQSEAMKQMRAADAQRQVADAARLTAQLEMPKSLILAPSPESGEQTADKPARVSPGVMAGNKIGGPNPVYPPDAKEKHVQGIVVLHVIIDKTGHIEDAQVVSSPDEALSKAALDAVEKWTYKPYLLNGNPVDVDSSINVNFSLTR